MTWEIVALAAWLLLNRVSNPSLHRRPGAFWTLQAVNAVVAILVLVVGIPGMENFPVANVAVAALSALHIALNLALRSRTLAVDEAEAGMKERRKKLRELGE